VQWSDVSSFIGSEEWAAENFFNGGPVFCLFAETVPDELLQVLADALFEYNFLAFHLLQQLPLVRAFPRRLLVQHFVEDHSKGEYI
jgi:hypothetical protein